MVRNTGESARRRSGLQAAMARGKRATPVQPTKFLVMALLGLATACKVAEPAMPPLPLSARPLPQAPESPPEEATLGDAQPPMLTASLVGRVPEGTFGPYLGTSGDKNVVAVWAALTEGEGHRWFTAPLGLGGEPLAPAREIGAAPSRLELVRVSPTAGGFVTLATVGTARGTRVEALVLGSQGELLAGPKPIVHGPTEILWIESFALETGNVVLWASSAGGGADLRLGALSNGGTLVGSPVTVFENARAWQAVGIEDGVAVVAVLAGKGATSRKLMVRFHDREGRRLVETTVSDGGHLLSDVDAALVGDQLVVGWVERSGLDDRLRLAALDPERQLSAEPMQAPPALGNQRLVRLLAAGEPGGNAFLVWEDTGQAPRGERRLRVASFAAGGKLAGADIEVAASGAATLEAEFATRGQGLAVLTRAPACSRTAASCMDLTAVPTFVELDDQLRVVASEPIRPDLGQGTSAPLAWGLHCSRKGCASLAALPDTPVPVYGVELRARSNHYAPAAVSPRDRGTPRALEVVTLAETERIADIATCETNRGFLVAWLTQFDPSTPYVRRKTPAPDGRFAPLRARLSVQSFDGRGSPTSEVSVISYRARSLGGISLAPTPAGRALLVWTALDEGQPQVFATALDAQGRRLRQRMLTHGRGEIRAVSAAASSRGLLASWIIDQKGTARAFTARLTTTLQRSARPRALSQVSESVSGISTITFGESAWLARVQTDPSGQSLRLSRLRLSDSSVLDERVIATSDSNQLSAPRLIRSGDGARLAWLERNADAASARVLRLDAKGLPEGEAVRLTASQGELRGMRYRCDDGACWAVADVRDPMGNHLETFALPDATPDGRGRWLVRRSTSSADPTAMALTPGGPFYANRRASQSVLQRADVQWR